MKPIETNQYGNVDIREGLPRGCCHIAKHEYGSIRISHLCNKLEIACAPAFVSFDYSHQHWTPKTDGIVIRSRCRKRLTESIQAVEAKKTKSKEQAKPIDYCASFQRKYALPQDALLDCANAMFNLNRFCKHERCSKSDSRDIYELKNEFVQYLYLNEYCNDVGSHVVYLEEKECWSCDGMGCDRCGDTGIYLPENTIEYYVFHFMIDSKPFCWHQPKGCISFPVKLTKEQEVMPELGVKELVLNGNNFQKEKSIALIRWFLAKTDSRNEKIAS